MTKENHPLKHIMHLENPKAKKLKIYEYNSISTIQIKA